MLSSWHNDGLTVSEMTAANAVVSVKAKLDTITETPQTLREVAQQFLSLTGRPV